jgi:hypothetical protein
MRAFLFGCFFLLTAAAFGQSLPPATDPVYKDWTFLGESNRHVDISYRLLSCEGVNQLHLFIFNESTDDQALRFTIVLTNEAGKTWSTNVSFTAEKTKMYKALCDSGDSLKALRIALPAGFNPARLTAKIEFKP